jgi:hypothetical protein
MSLVLEMVIKDAVKEAAREAAREAMHKYLYNNFEGAPGGGYNDTAGLSVIAKRRTHNMSWMDFSDCELRIVNEIEKNPGMGGKQIIAIMAKPDAAYADGECQENTTKVLLANLVKRKVILSSPGGYTLNDSDTPPPPILPKI